MTGVKNVGTLGTFARWNVKNVGTLRTLGRWDRKKQIPTLETEQADPSPTFPQRARDWVRDDRVRNVGTAERWNVGTLGQAKADPYVGNGTSRSLTAIPAKRAGLG